MPDSLPTNSLTVHRCVKCGRRWFDVMPPIGEGSGHSPDDGTRGWCKSGEFVATPYVAVAPLSDAQIEAGARAEYDREPWVFGQDAEGENVTKPWDEAPPSVHDYYRATARTVWEAISRAL